MECSGWQRGVWLCIEGCHVVLLVDGCRRLVDIAACLACRLVVMIALCSIRQTLALLKGSVVRRKRRVVTHAEREQEAGGGRETDVLLCCVGAPGVRHVLKSVLLLSLIAGVRRRVHPSSL